MKRYNVRSEGVAFPEDNGDWLSFNQVKEMLHFMAWPYRYTDEEIEKIIKEFDAKEKVW